jgi:hypothetical protein
MKTGKMETPRRGSFDGEYGSKNGKLMLPRSLWTETKKENVTTKPLAGKSETEVVIIGGGITGLSADIQWPRSFHGYNDGKTAC